MIWNHITRYRGGSVTRLVTQATPQQNGSYSLVYFGTSSSSVTA